MQNYSFIANSGVQLLTLRIQIDKNDKFKEGFHEWYDEETKEWKLEVVYEKNDEAGSKYYYRKGELLKGGHLADPNNEPSVEDLYGMGIKPIKVNDELEVGVVGDFYDVSFGKDNTLKSYEKVWIPVPYFSRKGNKFGPLNWSRMMMVPVKSDKGIEIIDIILAFDTRTTRGPVSNSECPVFDSDTDSFLELALCKRERNLIDYCAPDKEWSYVDKRLMNLVHPGVSDVGKLYNIRSKKLLYAATYIFLMNYLSKKNILPVVRLYKDEGDYIDVDMVIDIGNSKTTALLIEDPYKAKFTQVRPLSLTDFSNLVRIDDKGNVSVRSSNEPFDMRLAFRKVDFGGFGPKDSIEFIHPSFVRLGIEAMNLIHRSASSLHNNMSLSTFSSPKRYLWDGRPSQEEWQFLNLPGEKDDHVLELAGISDMLKSDGKFSRDGVRGLTSHYSPRSLMTLAFLEMLAQARVQINSYTHRNEFGSIDKRRRLKKIIVTCPTAMSRIERDALVDCARDAVKLISNFDGKPSEALRIEVVPSRQGNNDELKWYYDEATCSQLVYMFGEVGYKYRGNAAEFFSLYGKKESGEDKATLTVGSLDIGAGTTDMMISRYSYDDSGITTIIPEPLFYDSFYTAGDDILMEMIRNIMLENQESAFRLSLREIGDKEYFQRMSNFFGKDNNMHTYADKVMRRDFNIQYSVPLMSHFLELIKNGEGDRSVSYSEVFSELPPNEAVIEGFKERTGIDIRKLSWDFRNKEVSSVIEKSIEPLLKKIATIMYAHACDLIILSGRPASLPVIKDIFLKFYAVSADRLIVLNNYYVGKWYPFSKNTGYITNPKTIVSMGGIIGHYGSQMANLPYFSIDLTKLNKGLTSTAKFVETFSPGGTPVLVMTPDSPNGEIKVSYLPLRLNVRQINMPSYPARSLYVMDFNRHHIADRLERKHINQTGEPFTEPQLREAVREEIDNIRKRLPFTVYVERNDEDPETLSIVQVTDRNDSDIAIKDLEIHIQTLGTEERYWLDTGEFKF